MNILFCNSSNVSETKGGTERITARISQGLERLGHRCFLAYKDEMDKSYPLVKFAETINVNKASLEDFMVRNEIDVVIVQKMTRDVKMMVRIRERNRLDFKIISVFHFAPAFEEYNLSYQSFLRGIFHFNHIVEFSKNLLRFILYPFYKMAYPLRNQELYRMVYKYSDKVVLLSKSFISQYKDYAKLGDTDKFVVVPNALSFDEYLEECKLQEKKKQVLVVSRLVENPKKVSLAIKAWAEIEKDGRFEDWTFRIVGDGLDREKYEQLAKKLQLQRIAFLGRKNPKPYYMDSRVFLMTSAFEGWGLTLTEAMQFGCVPVAFDTYSSIHDIIQDGYNGYLVENKDLGTFVQKMSLLMEDETTRCKMARNAIRSSEEFDIHNVIGLWAEIIEKR